LDFSFDVNGTDLDNDELSYSVSSSPISDIIIEESTGLISWTADLNIFQKKPYRMDVLVSVSDGVFSINRTFGITVIPTQAPVAEMVKPEDESRVSSTGVGLKWTGIDPEGEDITYDLFIHKNIVFVQGFREEAMILTNLTNSNITIFDLEQGTKYFWTVQPGDGFSRGTCLNGIFSFKVNSKPTVQSIDKQEAESGKEFTYKVIASDDDKEDQMKLTYNIITAPDGLEITDDTGMIRWNPDSDQTGRHTVIISVSDGIEEVEISFEIFIKEGSPSSSSMNPLLIVIPVIILIVLAIVILLILMVRRRSGVIMDQEVEEKGEDADDRKRLYEDMYGTPAPDTEEDGMTARELKDYIHEQIEELSED
jgi:hypothetical protein